MFTVATDWTKLPEQVLENILSQLPILDLYLSATLVCKTWYEAIKNEKFIPWKKRYYRLKMGDSNEIEEMSNQLGITDASTSLIGVVKSMTKHTHLPTEGMLDCLKMHPKFTVAEAFIKERVLETEEEGLNGWCVIATLSVISETVEDITNIIRVMQHSRSPCLLQEVIDVLYCIAAFALYFRLQYYMNSGIHYRVYYALYLIEYQNTELVKSETQGEDRKERKLTPEQQRIVNHVISPNDTIKIVAFAGSGKTTTLLHFSKARPNVKFLNLMFNRSASDIAKRTFPSNVTSQTIHSLAFEAIGHSLKHKLKFKINPSSLYNFVSAPKKDKLAVVGMILRSISAYCNSVDQELTLHHVPDKLISKSGKNKEYTVEQRQSFVGEARAIWLMMINPKKKDVPISHDVYLKLFQLSKPVISSHDCILIDEAQDCSPVMLDIIQQQTIPKIFVGDPHQQIYAFRGAVNALTMINSTHTYYLTQSFRFGPEVAYIANCILEKYKNVTRQTLVGCAHSGDVTGRTVKKPIAILGRTNYGLFKEALELVSEFGRKFQGHFIGGFRFYNKEQLYDIYNLYLVQEKQKKASEIKLTDKVIKELRTFKALELYVEAAEDQDLRQRIQIVKKFGNRAVEFIEQVEQCCNMPFENADYIFSTVHKCKGMEFETVQLAKDNCFISCKYDRETGQIEYRERIGCSTREEPNIMYVAVTRAMRNLVMSSHVLHMLHCSQERFEYPVSLDVAQAKSGTLECVQCCSWPDDSSPKSLVLYRREVTLSNKVKVHGGPICSRCSTTESFNIVNNVISSRPAFMYKNIQNTTYLSMAPIVGPFPWEAKNTIKCADVKVTFPSYRVDFSQDDDIEEIEEE